MMGRLDRRRDSSSTRSISTTLFPEDHLVRRIATVLDLSWVHGTLAPHYSKTGRPSIDPDS